MAASLPGFPNPSAASALMPVQGNVTVPQSTALASGTGMLVPDTAVSEQMSNFPDTLYDLRPTSHLMRLMQALLGDSGAGQLRKRLLVSQLSAQTSAGTAFFDLDRFYGAIFNASRGVTEQLSVNPMDPATGVATPTEWEGVYSSDGAYRDRMNALAFGIAQGATQPGIVAAASAAIGAPVEVDESWAMMDAANGSGSVHTWGWLEARYPTWSSLAGQLWGPLEGQTFYGRSGSLTRSELLVRVHKTYPQTAAGRQAQAVDEWTLVRVLDQLLPAGLLMTVDTQAVTVGQPLQISAARSDSTHVEVVRQVTPVGTTSPVSPYPLSAGQVSAGVGTFDTRVLPVPPMSTRIGDSWTYSTASAQAAMAVSWVPDPSGPVDFTQPGAVPDLSSPVDEQQITWSDGTTTTYSAALGLLDPAQALAARVGSDGSLVAHPYSGDRRMVPTHT